VWPTRKLSTIHAYGKLYWEKIKPILDERWDQYIAENPDAGGKHLRSNWLNCQNKLLRELLDAETEEVKKEVEQRREEGIVSQSDHCVRSRSGISGFGDLGQDYEDGFRRGVVPKREISHVMHHVTWRVTSEDYTSQT